MTARSLPAGTSALAYYRVSTKKQGVSGLGLEAQRASVLAFAQERGLNLVEEFTEVETGTGKRRRPQLEDALLRARRTGAVLLIARLDRLARNVAFVSTLMESGVRFVAVDMPEVDNFTLHIVAAVAQREAEVTAERTRGALAAAKVRGVKIGRPENLTPEARAKGPAQNRQDAIDATRQARGYASTLREKGLSLSAIAGQLNADGFRTRRGGLWGAVQVKRVLDRVTR